MFTIISQRKLKEAYEELNHLASTMPYPICVQCAESAAGVGLAIMALNKYEGRAKV